MSGFNRQSVETTEYAKGTSLTMRRPWGTFAKARALCSDGRVRSTSRIAITADTFFSVPAAVKVKGKTVSGYITAEDQLINGEWQRVIEFRAVKYCKNYSLLPNED